MNEDLFIQRNMEIANAVMQTANKTISNVKAAYPKKKIFPNRGNHRQIRAKKILARFKLPFDILLGAANIYAIQSRPIPRFPSMDFNKLPATVFTEGCEDVISQSVKTIKISNQAVYDSDAVDHLRPERFERWPTTLQYYGFADIHKQSHEENIRDIDNLIAVIKKLNP